MSEATDKVKEAKSPDLDETVDKAREVKSVAVETSNKVKGVKSMEPYLIIGTQPIFVRGESYPPGQTVMLTPEEAAFPLSIGAIEPAKDGPVDPAQGVKPTPVKNSVVDAKTPFNTMAGDSPKTER